MDLDDFRIILSNSRVDVWSMIEAAISVAAADCGDELKDRRDGIVERLYSSTCRNCDATNRRIGSTAVKAELEREAPPEPAVKAGGSPLTPVSVQREDEEEDEELDPFGGLFDEEQTTILRIKEHLEDPDQSEDSLVELLQSLADMEITFKALEETDIGRHVNRLRKHPSNDVRRLVKQLVRRWKELVDEWVRLHPQGDAATVIVYSIANSSEVLLMVVVTADGDSPQQNILRNPQNGHNQVPDFAYSPNPHNGSSGSERNNSEPEQKLKAVPRREAPTKPPQPVRGSSSAPPPNRSQKETSIDSEKLASARRRLHENYQEAQNAKKQRTIQVMDIHEIPKPRNGFIAKNKGGFQGRHHR
ncbi:hypothetical protein RJ639_035900 [Escallonia herrerae]|uniref:TFIIS N-terminal domain-containing protein n=1 Tax=Escallonia herrerae TaxID=1293975 RepID=A0AA89B9P8_9ASTE|nr:hypothetical protein RJ639_035900 [Escallonia herrerae]